MNVAFIPVRGGSKSIPLKNIKMFNGYPLVYWTIQAAQKCSQIDKVYVATDSEKIKECINGFDFDKVEVIGRSAESASDTASTEFAMLEFATKYEFDNIVLIQATSPLLESEDLDRGMNIYYENGVDSVFSAVRQKRFYWQQREGEYAHPLNYDYMARPRRQEFDGCLVENGAFYITSKERLLVTKCRMSGNIKAVEMREETFYEIDEPSDWVIMEELMKKRSSKEEKTLWDIKMFLTDSDGCLTDGGMYYSENGDELKKFNTKDGMGFQRLRESGIITGIVTGENVELVKRRAKKLKLDICKLGIKDKLSCVTEICKEYNISLENVAYVGDDINDLSVIEAVGFGCCVKNAHCTLKKKAKYIANANGGEGAIREIADKILENGV